MTLEGTGGGGEGHTSAPHRAAIEPSPRWPDRRALEIVVARGAAAGLDIAVAVVKLDGVPKRRGIRPGRAAPTALPGLPETLRRTLGCADGIYRLGRSRFAVLATGAGAAQMGELMLWATCVPGPRFSWGVAGPHGLGAETVQEPDTLLLLAEADLELRRRDLSHANGTIARRRLISVGSIAAASFVIGGLGLSLDTSPGIPAGQPLSALAFHAMGSSAPRGHPSGALPPLPTVPSTSAPATTPTPSPPPTSIPSLPPPSASVALPGTGLGTASPATTVPLGTNQPLSPSSPPTSTPPVTVVPGGGVSTAATHGNSATAPGHIKSHGSSLRRT